MSYTTTNTEEKEYLGVFEPLRSFMLELNANLQRISDTLIEIEHTLYVIKGAVLSETDMYGDSLE
jgi:hypothetical protein